MAKLTLNDHLFESLEWLSDRTVKGDDLSEEIRRAEAKCKVAEKLIASGKLYVDAIKAADGKIEKTNLPKLLAALTD
jgi:hypothetical protein